MQFVLCVSIFSQEIKPFPETCDFISESPEGLLYLGTTQQAFSFDGHEFYPKPWTQKGNPNIQSPFYFDHHHRIWFCNYESLVSFDPYTQSSALYRIPKVNGGFENADYYSFGWAIPNERLFVRQGKQLYVFNLKNHVFEPLGQSVSGKRVKTDTVKKRHFTYYFTYQPMVFETDAQAKSVTKTQKWKNWPAGCMLQDVLLLGDGRVLLFGDCGLFVGDPQDLTFSEIQWNNKSINRLLCAERLDSNAFIVSTADQGLLLLYFDDQMKLQNLRSFHQMILEHPVQRMFRKKDGSIVMSSYGKFIAIFHPEKHFVCHYPYNGFEASSPLVFNNRIFIADPQANVYEMKNGNQWTLSSSGNLQPFSLANNSLGYYYFTVLNDNFEPIALNQGQAAVPKDKVFRFFQSDYGDQYLSTMGGKVFKKSGQTWQDLNMVNQQHHVVHYVNSIQRILLITGLNEEFIRIHPYNHPGETLCEIPFSGDLYNQVFDSTRNVVYLSSSMGLLRLSLRNFELELLELSDRKLSKTCNCIVQDQKGKIWGSKRSGLFYYDPESKFSTHLGVQPKEQTGTYLPGACGFIQKDSIFFTHTHFFSTLNIAGKTNECMIPQVYLNELILNYKRCSNADTLMTLKEMVLPYQQNTIGFTLRSIQFIPQDALKLYYYLSPLESYWNVSDKTNVPVSYVKLKPGKYQFYYKAEWSGSPCESTLHSFPIEILAPFWMKPWFRLSIMLVVLLLAFVGFNMHYQRQLEKKDLQLREQRLLIEKQHAIEQERSRIASEMHDDLGSGLTTIRYLSDRALRQATTAEEKSQIRKISEQSNGLLRNMSEIIWALNLKNDTLSNLMAYLRRYAHEYLEEHGIPLHWEMDALTEEHGVSGEKRRNILLSFKEVLHNLVKHAQADQVSIQCKHMPQWVSIAVADNGKGFDLSSANDKGNGLYNLRKRMKSLNGEVDIQSGEMGTKITLRFPVGGVLG